MPRNLRLGAGLAAIAVTAIVMMGVWTRGPSTPGGVGGLPSIGGSPATSSPSVSTPPSSPSPTPTVVPPSFAGVRALEDVGGGGKLEPGTYSISSIEPLEIRFTVPRGWEVPPGAPEFLGPTGQTGREIGGLSFWTPAQFYADPCRSAPTFLVELPEGATVDDVVRRLAALWPDTMSTPTAVTLGGFNGKYVSLTAPCGADTRYWVLDVEGKTLIVIAHVWEETGADGAAELQGIVDSVEIEVKGS